MMHSTSLATTSLLLLLSFQTITALPTTPPTLGSPKGVIVVSAHGKRDPIVIGSGPVKGGGTIAPPHVKKDADAEAEAEAAPGGSAWGGR